jgi:hypothetical protein
MNIEIKYIAEANDERKERLVLSVLRDDDIGNYVVFATTTSSQNAVITRMRHSFWFPDRKICAGDLVVLYTKKGVTSEKKNSDGSTTHFFYMNIESPIFKSLEDCAVLLHVDHWSFKKVSRL